ncbi:uncharacterized protein LOC125149892 [Prionailurus viverrinus]|uniref:uncharacterized protein LOC125149892 n=1 Tax=Prionailurus viverrinus TaxID=61388 RepID=UPI001FF5A965|nr:uncharacterized protein LOC125149892 [Prionailurus viverrinus]
MENETESGLWAEGLRREGGAPAAGGRGRFGPPSWAGSAARLLARLRHSGLQSRWNLPGRRARLLECPRGRQVVAEGPRRRERARSPRAALRKSACEATPPSAFRLCYPASQESSVIRPLGGCREDPGLGRVSLSCGRRHTLWSSLRAWVDLAANRKGGNSITSGSAAQFNIAAVTEHCLEEAKDSPGAVKDMGAPAETLALPGNRP